MHYAPQQPHDKAFMRVALSLSRRGLGQSWPNPSVGCVIVKNGSVLGRGVTAKGGRPHAETFALAMAGEAARGAEAYVTLEPCSHQGKTSPCVDALIQAGIARVIIAIKDEDRRVQGSGIARLLEAGIAVTVGVEAASAEQLHSGFFKVQHTGLPLVALKLATSLDGRIATAEGESRWITGEIARQYAHRLRAEYDAILVGGATFRHDAPLLTCRLPGMEGRSPVRVVVSRTLEGFELQHPMVKTACDVPVWVVTSEAMQGSKTAERMVKQGVNLFFLPEAGQHLSWEAIMKTLAGQGITRVLVEGGAEVACGLLGAGLVDEVCWFFAPVFLGANGIPAVGSLPEAALAAMPRFHITETVRLGADTFIKAQVKP